MSLINSEKLSEWFLDISKYVTTGILVTSFLGDITEKWVIYIVSIIVVFTTLFVGMWLSNMTENKKNTKKNK